MPLELLHLDPRALEADPGNVRQQAGDLSGLAQTIEELGVLQPIGVAPMNDGSYRVVYGNRRHRAALELGLPSIPCLVVADDGRDRFVRQLVENVQRLDLNDIEQAEALYRLRERVAARHPRAKEADLDDLTGREVGLSGRTVRRYLGLRSLPPVVQEMMRHGELGLSHAQHVLSVKEPSRQEQLAGATVRDGLSAVQVRQIAAMLTANSSMTVEQARESLAEGGRPQAATAPRTAPTPRPAAPAADPEGDADLWDDQPEVGEAADEGRKPRVAGALDGWLGDLDRLVASALGGELARWAAGDDQADIKLNLALRQVRHLDRRLHEIAENLR